MQFIDHEEREISTREMPYMMQLEQPATVQANLVGRENEGTSMGCVSIPKRRNGRPTPNVDDYISVIRHHSVMITQYCRIMHVDVTPVEKLC